MNKSSEASKEHRGKDYLPMGFVIYIFCHEFYKDFFAK